MKVKDLISLLQQFNQDLEIKYSSYSEGCQMDISGIDIENDILDLNQQIAVITE